MKKSFEAGNKIRLDLPNEIYIKKCESEITTSEGEGYIEWFFEKHEIKYFREVEIHGLKNDVVRSRRADFYLPKYKIFVEFNGLYNESKEHRTRYKTKMQVYGANKIPFIALYPDNIGALDYYFFERLGNVLFNHKMKIQLIKYKWKMFFKDHVVSIIAILLTMFIWMFFLGLTKYYVLFIATILGTLGLIEISLNLFQTLRTTLNILNKPQEYFNEE